MPVVWTFNVSRMEALIDSSCTDKCRKQDIGSFSIKAAPPLALDLWPGTHNAPHNAKQVKRSANNKMEQDKDDETMRTTTMRQRNGSALRFNNLPQD
ncbi:hypothetical protein ACLKA6_010653 [Drosophila palustris]